MILNTFLKITPSPRNHNKHSVKLKHFKMIAGNFARISEAWYGYGGENDAIL